MRPLPHRTAQAELGAMTDTPPMDGDHADGMNPDGRTADQRRQDRVRAMEQLMQAAWAFADTAAASTESTTAGQGTASGQ